MERGEFTREELQAGITAMMRARAECFGTLNSFDVIAMLGVAGYDGVLTESEFQEMAQVASQYAGQFEPFGLLLLQSTLQEIQASGQVTPNPPKPPQPAPQPTRAPARPQKRAPARPPTPPPANIDSRLVGRWNYTKYYSAGDFSSTVSRDMVLYGDGRFEEDGSVGANLKVRDSGGNWEGTSSAYSGANPGEYGRWEAKNGVLTLNYADDTYCQYRYEVGGPKGDRSLLTRSSRGKEMFWKEY